MNKSLVSCLACTSVFVLACGKGCVRDPVIPDDDYVTFSPTKRPTATPTPTPTMEIKTFVVPQRVKVGETFVVKAYVASMEILEVYADDFRLGYMGWDSTCRCKTLAIKLNTAGERNIRFVSGNTDVASEIVLVEAE